MKLYRGWLINGTEHMLFEGMFSELKPGDKITTPFGAEWEVDFITYE